MKETEMTATPVIIRILTALGIGLVSLTAWGRGEINFVNMPDSLVYMPDGVTPVSGPAFLAQLYAGPRDAAESSLQPFGKPTPFLWGVAAGRFTGGLVVVPYWELNADPFDNWITAQVRVYEAAAGSFEAAQAGAGLYGKSVLLHLSLPTGIVPPGEPLRGLVSFSLVPEPPVMLLAVLGGVMLGLPRWLLRRPSGRRASRGDGLAPAAHRGDARPGCRRAGREASERPGRRPQTRPDSPRWAGRCPGRTFSGSGLSYGAGGWVYDNAASQPYWFYFPSLAVNPAGDMVLGFSGSKATEYIGAFWLGRLANGSFPERVTLVQAGRGPWNAPRVGDYSATTLEPGGAAFWTGQQYGDDFGFGAGPDYWGTWITAVKAAP